LIKWAENADEAVVYSASQEGLIANGYRALNIPSLKKSVNDKQSNTRPLANDSPVRMRLQLEQAANSVGARSLQSLRPSWYRQRETLRAIKALSQRADIAIAEPNYYRYSTAMPSDTGYLNQDHYNTIKLPAAWDITTGNANVIVAVIDTGVFLAHEDFAGKLVSGYDFISDTSYSKDGDGIDSNPDDPGDGSTISNSSWHGTHVTGTVAAATDNNTGVAGVGWDTRVMPLRVLGKDGIGSSYDVMQAMRYAARLNNDSGTRPNQAVDIINLSLGANESSQLEQALVTQIRNLGITIVAAAGNDGNSRLSYPASYNGVISVGATNVSGTLHASYSNSNEKVDIAAPGGDGACGINSGILSTFVRSQLSNRASTYQYLCGTSMATPHVSGVIALMKAAYPSLTPQDFDDLLANGSITGISNRSNDLGYGLVNADLAVTAANNLNTDPTITPVPALQASPDNIDLGTNEETTVTVTNTNSAAPLN
ncbi:MAG: S8 family peptidase, partial [Oleibacter sp.]|nr:S8 family peptidase [Thalassolituus sp.]